MPAQGASWMPGLWADSECKKEELSARFWESTATYRQQFAQLGFRECGFSKVTRHLDRSWRDSGEVFYLDPSRSHLGMLVYAKVDPRKPIVPSVERVAIVFTAALHGRTISCTNNQNAFDPIPSQRVIRLSTLELELVHQRFLAELHNDRETPLAFPDKQSLQRWFDANQLATFENRVRRGLFVKMTDAEVQQALRNFPPPLPR